MTEPSEVQEKPLSARVEACLNTIIDPCSVAVSAPAGLVDMGLVNRVELLEQDGGGTLARIKIGITHPFCMMAGVFLGEVRKRVGEIDGISGVDVSLDSDTMWTPRMMTPEYRERLASVRSASAAAKTANAKQ